MSDPRITRPGEGWLSRWCSRPFEGETGLTLREQCREAISRSALLIA